MKRAREDDTSGPAAPSATADDAAAPLPPQAAAAAAAGSHHAGADRPPHNAATTNFTAPSAALTIDASAYASQLDAKLQKLKALFSDLPMPEVDVRTSEPQHFRMRAEFNVWGTHAGERPHYIMYATTPATMEVTQEEGEGGKEVTAGSEPAAADRDGGEAAGPGGEAKAATEASGVAAAAALPAAATAAVTDGPAAVPSGGGGRGKGQKGRRKQQQERKPRAPRVEITSFPVGSRAINEMMPVVLEACSNNPLLKTNLFQVRGGRRCLRPAAATPC